MDKITDLPGFQRVLLEADRQYSFANLKFREGNEEKIKFIAEQVFGFLREKRFINFMELFEEFPTVNSDDDQYKKLALYLVLNAELPALEEMSGLAGVGALVRTLPALEEMSGLAGVGALVRTLPALEEMSGLAGVGALVRTLPALEEMSGLAGVGALVRTLPALEEMSGLAGVGALVRTLPALPGPLLSALLRRPQMRPFLYEMVAFCRPALALQLADACIADIQPGNMEGDPDHPARMAEALYRLACHLRFVRAPPAGARDAALAGLRACLAHYNRPPFDCSVYLTWALGHSFDVIEACFGRLRYFERFDVYNIADIYRATHDPDGLVPEALEFKLHDSPDRAISESLSAYNALLLEHGAALMMHVSKDKLRAWNDSDLVQEVGEMCYRMNAVLQRIPDAADHPLVGMLEQNSIEPCDLDTVIDVVDPDVIVAKIRVHDATSAAWLDALLGEPGLCSNPVLFQLLLSEVATLTEDQSAQLIDNITSELWILKNVTEDWRTLMIGAFRRCNDFTKYRFLHKQFHGYFNDDLMTVDFEAALSETFDRLGAGEAGLGDALAVFVQSPRRTLERLVRAAGDGAAQTERMLHVTKLLGGSRGQCYREQSEPALVLAVNAALDDAAAAGDDARCQHLARFVEELVRRRLLREELLRQSTPEARAAATADKENDNKSMKELRPEDITAGSCKNQTTDEATTSSGSLDKQDETKPSSGSLDKQDETKPSSGSLDKQDEAKPSSGSLDKQDEAKPSSGSLDKQDETKPSSGSLDKQDETKPSSGSLDKQDETKPSSGSLDKQDETKPSSGSLDKQDEPKPSSGSLDKQDETKPSSGSLDKQDETKPSSGSLDKQDETKPSSGSLDKQDETKPSSGSLDKQDETKPSSGSLDKQDETKPSSGSLDKQDETKPSSGSLDKQDAAKPSSGSFGEQAEGPRPGLEG